MVASFLHKKRAPKGGAVFPSPESTHSSRLTSTHGGAAFTLRRGDAGGHGMGALPRLGEHALRVDVCYFVARILRPWGTNCWQAASGCYRVLQAVADTIRFFLWVTRGRRVINMARIHVDRRTHLRH